MTRHDIPAALADWTQNMLTGRILIANHGDSNVHGFSTKECPQGEILSPLLWCLVVNELLYKLQKTGFLAFGYADVAIIVRSNFLPILKETMGKALKITQDWCQLKRLRANLSKIKAMIFTRKYKPEAIEPLRLCREDIEYVQSVKYLGVHLDTKLNWKTHLDIKKSKFYASYWACRRAMGKSWGIKLNTALWIYKTVLVPRLPYAVVWWPRVEKMESKNLLKSLYKQDRISKVRQVDKAVSINLTTKADWKNRNLLNQPSTHAWFTDGSGANGCYGAGIYCPGSNHRKVFSLGKLATVFQAEVLAILECARLLLSRETKTRRINIYTNSKAAIGALAKTTTESLVVWDCMQALNGLGERNNITLVWVPGYQGIQGNEVADSLAKLCILEEPVCQIVGVPFATGKNHIKD
ncbi:uncharacterized protein LOC109863050 [Pseudomyrmex gracilis]|uniref:uncharacterized protein LOC109863050 n=1 Tax=Pseudomyrmex gracilis TaxID=219809 RepID=UPI000995C5C9|nr:uncharacterized protein LOC109863050 [Pseudomyrmex gracilis]